MRETFSFFFFFCTFYISAPPYLATFATNRVLRRRRNSLVVNYTVSLTGRRVTVVLTRSNVYDMYLFIIKPLKLFEQKSFRFPVKHPKVRPGNGQRATTVSWSANVTTDQNFPRRIYTQ